MKKYVQPETSLIVLGIENRILGGSSEGGGGNENYAPRLNTWEDYLDLEEEF